MQTRSEVAVKLFHHAPTREDPVQTRAWQNEMVVYSKLASNPNLARFVGWDKLPSGEPFIVIEWLEGDLWTFLETNPLEGWDDYWPIAEGVLLGLTAIHEAGFIHRDLKPENILHDKSGIQKVADFGTTRLEETVSWGLTVAQLGTVPYCPPEVTTSSPTFAYDIYSFAVLTLCCLQSSVPRNHEDALQQLENLDIPTDIHDVLRSCLKNDPAERPESAGILLGQLSDLQRSREDRRGGATRIHFDLPAPVSRDLAETLGCGFQEAAERVQRELQDGFHVHFARGSRNELEIVTGTLLLKLQRHNSRKGLLRVQRIARVHADLADKARNQWHKPRIDVNFTTPLDTDNAEQLLLEFEDEIRSHESRLNANQTEDFLIWRQLLQARFDLVRSEARPVTYSSWRRDGNRLAFECDSLENIATGDQRLVRAGKRVVISGEIELVGNGKVVLYVERGDVKDAPKSGSLEMDTGATLKKLQREQDAVAQLSARQTVRKDLHDLLLDPSVNTIPVAVPDVEFIQENLDKTKQTAVSKALGAEDFLLVKGPPGTGKTTFIAELVAQTLKHNPTARILLSSQTHIALDNALVRIADLCPDASLVRIGREEKLAEAAAGYGLKSVLANWSDKVGEATAAFMQAFALERGIDLENPDLEQQLGKFQLLNGSKASIRSKQSVRQSERAEIKGRLNKQQGLSKRVISAASDLEQRVAGDSPVLSDMVSAVEEFIRVGLDVATSLDGSQGAVRRLAELEDLLADGRRQLNALQAESSSLRRTLETALAVASPLSDEDLIQRGSTMTKSTHPEIARLQALGAEWRDRFGQTPEFSSIVLSESNVIAATCVGLGSIRGAENVDFDLCILDEASKATATESLVPLIGSQRWVLVGDQKQLPPFVEHILQDRKFLEEYELSEEDARQTLFDVLAASLPDHSTITLNHQHRMHPSIGQLVSECFYGGQLTSEKRSTSSELKLALPTPVSWLDTSKRTDHSETRHGSTFSNLGEARTIQKLLERLQFTHASSGRILKVVLLTGYEAQRKELERTVDLIKLQLPNLEVSAANVDSFQGQESDVAVFSVTRSNPDGKIGFLAETERLNVALSRGKDALVVVGDADFVSRLPPNASDLQDVYRYISSHPSDCSIEVSE